MLHLQSVVLLRQLTDSLTVGLFLRVKLVDFGIFGRQFFLSLLVQFLPFVGYGGHVVYLLTLGLCPSLPAAGIVEQEKSEDRQQGGVDDGQYLADLFHDVQFQCGLSSE